MREPWKLLHLDLANGLEDLPTAPGYAGVCLYLWWQSLPIGELTLPPAQLPMTQNDLRNEISKAVTQAVGDRHFDQGFKASLPILYNEYPIDPLPPLDAIAAMIHPLAQLPESPILENSVSVIVCTRDRPEAMEKCLPSLLSLNPAPQEIIVVDNAPSTSQTQDIVAHFPNVKYIRELQPGLSHARNCGIAAATGDIIAFTDDDVEVHPDWITGLLQGFATESVQAVTGLMLPTELKTPAQVYFQQVLSGPEWGFRRKTFDYHFFSAMQKHSTPVWMIGAGANMAFRREIFDQVGYFDPRLGAGTSGCSEDSEMWYRILAAGGTCQYEPAAVVFHQHRATFSALKSQTYQYMRGHVAALMIQFAQHRHWGNLKRLLLVLPYYYLRRIARVLIKGKYRQNRMLSSELSGYVSGLIDYWHYAFSPNEIQRVD